MKLRHVLGFATIAVLVTVLSVFGCSDSTSPTTLTLTITPADTVLLGGRIGTFQVIATDASGRVEPDSVIWSVSDTTVLSLLGSGGSTASIEAVSVGNASVEVWADGATESVPVSIPAMLGDMRWHTPLEGTPAGSAPPALNEWGRVYVVRSRELSALNPDGQVLFTVNADCNADQSPSIDDDRDRVYINGQGCTQSHAYDGTLEWRLPIGYLEGGLAIDLDGSVVVYHGWDGGYVSRVSSAGTEVWTDTLSPNNGAKSAPVIAADGEIYLSWLSVSGGSGHLSRIGPSGDFRWTLPLPRPPLSSNPAVFQHRVLVTVPAYFAVFDTAGNLLWDVTLEGLPSSPIHDGSGNIYVQTSHVLLSYALDGHKRWEADTLDCNACAIAVGAPTLVAGDELLVPCRSTTDISIDEICSVDTTDGTLAWRSNIGTSVRGAVAVADNGTIYVQTLSGLAALWGDRPPHTNGWPTEGRDMQRQRRQY